MESSCPTTLKIVEDTPEQRTLYTGGAKIIEVNQQYHWEAGNTVEFYLDSENGDEAIATLTVLSNLNDGTSLLRLDRIQMPNGTMVVIDDSAFNLIRVMATYPDGPWFGTRAAVKTNHTNLNVHGIKVPTEIYSPVALSYALSRRFLG